GISALGAGIFFVLDRALRKLGLVPLGGRSAPPLYGLRRLGVHADLVVGAQRQDAVPSHHVDLLHQLAARQQTLPLHAVRLAEHRVARAADPVGYAAVAQAVGVELGEKPALA